MIVTSRCTCGNVRRYDVDSVLDVPACDHEPHRSETVERIIPPHAYERRDMATGPSTREQDA